MLAVLLCICCVVVHLTRLLKHACTAAMLPGPELQAVTPGTCSRSLNVTMQALQPLGPIGTRSTLLACVVPSGVVVAGEGKGGEFKLEFDWFRERVMSTMVPMFFCLEVHHGMTLAASGRRLAGAA